MASVFTSGANSQPVRLFLLDAGSRAEPQLALPLEISKPCGGFDSHQWGVAFTILAVHAAEFRIRRVHAQVHFINGAR